MKDCREFFYEVVVVIFKFFNLMVEMVVGNNCRDSSK